MRRLLRRSAWAVIAASAAALPTAVQAQDFADKVKAAFLFNFAQFVTWPVDRLADDAPLVICVLGDAEFGQALSTSLEGKRRGPHALQARLIEHPDEVSGCHTVYLPDDAMATLSQAQRQALTDAGVLSVHEQDAALPDGVIRFYLENRRVRFEINRRAADAAGLRISSKLLGVAKVVEI